MSKGSGCGRHRIKTRRQLLSPALVQRVPQRFRGGLPSTPSAPSFICSHSPAHRRPDHACTPVAAA